MWPDTWEKLRIFVSLIFVGKRCVFVSRPMTIVTFLRKNGETPKRVVDFHPERDTFPKQIMEIVKDFDEKSNNYNGKQWKSSKVLRGNLQSFAFFSFHCLSLLHVFFSFFHFLHFHFSAFVFFRFFIFSFFYFFHFVIFF